jgi:hypothetical protein
VILENDRPVLLCRRELEPPAQADQRAPDRILWRTVEPPAQWVESCETLEKAHAIAAERAQVLNTLARLFDANTAVSLYKRWEGDLG